MEVTDQPTSKDSDQTTLQSYDDQPRQKIRDYWPRYRRQAISFTILMQIAVCLTILGGLYINGINLDPTILIVIGIALLTASIAGNLLLINQLLYPLKDLTSAITHVSGEPSDITPPNPNSRQHQRDGFSPLLQKIYELSTSDPADFSKADSTDLLQTALDHASGSLVIFDETGKILYASTGAPVNQKGDEPSLRLIFEDEVNFDVWLGDSRERLVHSAATWFRVADRIIGDEKRRVFDITANYEKGSAAPVVMMLFDRTEHYQPEDDQLDFLAFAAHELRGPVTVIRGYADVLLQETEGVSDRGEDRELLTRLVVSASRLSGYISNILNASRFDRRHLKFEPKETSLAQIYALIADDMQLRAQTQNRLLSINIPSDLPTVAADASSLSEVLSNLIDNAIKYSFDGGVVSVNATVESESIHVEVVDNGIGMPSNVVGNLFHRFYRSHRSRETVAGTGIGLYICKAIIESHGGTIEVKSEEGRGSTFSFTVPIYTAVADKLVSSDNTNANLIRSGSGSWIKNHSKYRG